MSLHWKRIRLLITLPVGVLVVGIAGSMLFEGLPFADALYFTIVTITTVGYGDIHPTTIGGKIFSIVLIVIGIGTFLTILTNLTQMFIQRDHNKLRKRRLNMLIGVFFTEVGNRLLHMFAGFDPEVLGIRNQCLLDQDCSELDFADLRKKFGSYTFVIDPDLMDLEAIANLLDEKGDFLVRQIESPDLLEHESYTGLLWAIVHLRDELFSRPDLAALPQEDREHLANDVRRAYIDLVKQWVNYMQYLKRSYPYLFSLALRTNPFHESPNAVITK